MCGIAGSFRAEFDVEGALTRIAHRGPDGRGVATADGWMVLGHVRLAIQDPTPRSDQPFLYESIALTYVGELWNADELREKLGSAGHAFRTTGDTEVVAAALSEWGFAALRILDGQFALAWYDRVRQEAWLARDRWGETPLYMVEREATLLGPGGVVWASERKAFEREERHEALLVPPGFAYDMRSRAWRPFYRLVEPDPVLLPSGRVRRLLADGTEKRLAAADVPVCCLISGGLDSAFVLALAKQVKPDVTAYVATLDDQQEDFRAACEVAKALGVPLTAVAVPEPDEAALRRAVWAIETPMQAQVEIATLCMPLAEKIAADGFKVVLSGEGADELFGGYGGLMRRGTTDDRWREARRGSWEKQARANFLRTNKVFMAAGVEARLPFAERGLVELALSLGLNACPPKKELLRAAAGKLVPDVALARPKMTFQEGAGLKARLEDRAGKSRVRAYNDMARDLFGGVPKNK